MLNSTHVYHGNCHCGANRYEVRLPNLPALVICKCVLCAKKGYVWVYNAYASLKVTKGCAADTLTTYIASGTQGLKHEFCSTCGTGLFGTHSSGAQAGRRGINFRVLVSETKEIFLKGRDVVVLDSSGAAVPYQGPLSLVEKGPATEPAEFCGDPPSDALGDELKLYTGGCDCGAVQIALRTKALFEVDIKEDNCSICIRNGFVGVYPHKSQVTLSGKDQTQEYKFGRAFNGSPFCRTCGVQCFSNLYGPPKEIVAKLPEAKQAFVRKQLEVQPLNIRVLDGVEWDKIHLQWNNDGTEGYVLPE